MSAYLKATGGSGISIQEKFGGENPTGRRKGSKQLGKRVSWGYYCRIKAFQPTLWGHSWKESQYGKVIDV